MDVMIERTARGEPHGADTIGGLPTLTPEERYLFDLQGFLVVKGALAPELVETLNEELDAAGVPELMREFSYVHTGLPDDDFYRGNQDPDAGPVDVYNGLLLDWGPAVRSLVDHELLLPYLEVMLGRCARLDHAYAIVMRRGAGASVPHHLHNGGTPFDPSQYYVARDGQMHNGMVVVSYALTDVAPGAGGFCVVPGSHKSAFPAPAGIAGITDDSPPVVHISMGAGDVVIFTEAVTHGGLAWNAETERRALLFKYCPGHLQWERDSPMADLSHDWSARQRQMLTGPYFGRRRCTVTQPAPPVPAS